MKVDLQETELPIDAGELRRRNSAFGDAPLVLERNENADPREAMMPCTQEFYEGVFSEDGPFWSLYSELSFAARPVNAQYACFVSGRMYYLRNTERRFLYAAGPAEEYCLRGMQLSSEKKVSLRNLLLLLSAPFDAARQQTGIIELAFLANEAVEEFEAYAKEAKEYYSRSSQEIEDPYRTAKEALGKAVEAMRYANLATLCSSLKIRLKAAAPLEKCEAKELREILAAKDYGRLRREYGFYSLTPYDISKPRFREDTSALERYGFPEAPMEYSMRWRENAKYACARYLDVQRMAYQMIGKQTHLGDAVFFLRTGELACESKAGIIEQRKAEYEKYAKTIPPARIVIYNRRVYAERRTQRSDAVIRGRSVSSQRTVRGVAYRVDSLDDYGRFKEGGVIIAKNLSPNLTMLYSKAAAVVSETGSAMAHAAIIAREMRIPCIVEADTSGITEGQQVEVNGLTGELRALD